MDLTRAWTNAPTKLVTVDSLNPSVKYALKETKSALQLATGARLAEGNEVLYANVDSSHGAGQEPPTFVQQVLALYMAPFLLETPGVADSFAVDAIARVREYSVTLPNGSRPFSDARGCLRVRQEIAQYINSNHEGLGSFTSSTSPEDIILQNGASDCVRFIMQSLLRGSNDAVLVPQPGAPLYAASVSLHGGTPVAYRLDETGWSGAVAALEQVMQGARLRGLSVRALVVASPDCLTSQSVPSHVIAQILKFCHQWGLVVIADEVLYGDSSRWAEAAPVSVRGVLASAEPLVQSSLQMFSVNSLARGEGLRGCFCEAVNCEPGVVAALRMLVRMGAAPSALGQLALCLKLRPPAPGDASFESHLREMETARASLLQRAGDIVQALDKLTNVQCRYSHGALHCISYVTLPASVQAAAVASGLTPDEFYCSALLAETGILVSPGSVFEGMGLENIIRGGQVCFLMAVTLPEERVSDILARFARFNERFMGEVGVDGDLVASYMDLVLNCVSHRAKL